MSNLISSVEEFLQSGEIDNKFSSYLRKFANVSWRVEAPDKNYSMIVVVPAIDEFENIRKLVNSLKAADPSPAKMLVLFVINSKASADETVKAANRKTLDFLRSENCRHFDIGIVDAATSGNEMPEKHGGVGLARKIGLDIALCLISPIEKQPIMVCLDADCTVEQKYFSVIWDKSKIENFSAGYVNFEHPIPGNLEEASAIISYEIFMRYYVLSLRYSGSQFAFHTVGSTMVFTPDAYIRAGGMNRKKAGEDFYFMGKLGKLYPIRKIEGTAVYPSPRASWRVPFGTGQRVGRFMQGTHEEYRLHDFQIFIELKKFLKVLFSDKAAESDSILRAASEINPQIKNFLLNNRFAEQFQQIVIISRGNKQLYKQKLNWFDGFRTMKLIHFLRDECYPDEPMFEVLDTAFKLSGIEPPQRTSQIPPLDIQLDYLKILRRIA